MRILIIAPENSFPESGLRQMQDFFSEKNMVAEVANAPEPWQKGAFDAVILAGDDNVLEFDIDLLENILSDVLQKGGVVGAVDCAPLLLAFSGIAPGKCLTCRSKFGGQIHKSGSIFTQEPVVVDENIVTADSAEDLSKFLEGFASLIK